VPIDRPTRLRTPSAKPDEDGFILLAVLILLALFTIALSVALPKMAIEVQHDRDQETMERGKQYVRAIKLYYKKFGAYPPNLDALNKTNDIRFLRKKYIDPTTGKVDWKPIMMCQNKTPAVMGFFGEPLVPAGCGAGIGVGLAGSLPGSTTPGGGATGIMGGLFNNSSTGGSSSSLFSNPSSGSTPGGAAPNGATPGTSSGDSSSGGTDANGNPTGGTTGPTFGGGGIIGVSPASPKKSLYVFKKKDHYNQWEFLYNPQQDAQNGGGMGLPGGGTGLPGTGTGLMGTGTTGTGTGMGFGGTGNSGSTPITPTPTPQPNPQ